jgi:hypothetical protein
LEKVNSTLLAAGHGSFVLAFFIFPPSPTSNTHGRAVVSDWQKISSITAKNGHWDCRPEV